MSCEPTTMRLTIRYRDGSAVLVLLFESNELVAMAGNGLPGMFRLPAIRSRGNEGKLSSSAKGTRDCRKLNVDKYHSR